MPSFDQPIPMKHQAHHMVPRPLVIAMFALMLGSVALVSVARLADLPLVGVVPDAPIVAERSVILSGDRNGAYVVTDPDGTVIASSADDKAGFIGVVGMVIKRERVVQGVAIDAPVRIVERATGSIAIIDDTTGKTTELLGYGADNIAAFARLLD